MVIAPSRLQGEITIPGSKSHTIRALIIATLAAGVSTIHRPLLSADTLSCLQGCQMFGAGFEDRGDHWKISGTGGNPKLPHDIVDVGNSGTSMSFFIGVASLIDGYTVLSGDAQIKHRPVQPLLDALTQLGAVARSLPQNGCPPVIVKGRIAGGYAEVRGSISQYVSSLLLSCPLGPADTEIRAINLGEKPYVQMTLHWLDRQGIAYRQDGLEHFWIKGRQSFTPFDETIPADFSSATFFLCAAGLPGCEVVLHGLDFNDPQGDKAVVGILRQMGADIRLTPAGLHIRGRQLHGIDMDLADMPDALPALAVAGCLAQGTTRIRNVAHARLKETDRIAVMCRELRALGARVEEHQDGMSIHQSRLAGGTVDSHHDHRIAMALAIAGLAASEPVTVLNAESIAVTFPQFPELLRQLGAAIHSL